MAFLSKFGNILRQSAGKQINSDLSSFKLWTHQAVRCMSSMGGSKLFIGGISYQTDDGSLREAFARYGDVVDARIITDRESGRSRGFGFVTYATPEGASSAIQALDGKDLHGRVIRVNYANERPPRSSFGYGGGDGGYGGGGGSYGGGGGGYSGGGGGYGGRGGGGYNSYGNDSYNSGGNYGSGNSFETASGGGYGNSTNFAPSGSVATGSADNFGVGGGDSSFPTGGGFGDSPNYGSPGSVGTGGADNFGVGGSDDSSFPNRDDELGYQSRA
ncbi:putative nucleotide-binding alpha-beta plait domain-containing protein [Rosa chinensis]|uniref:Putative nucleotide-binding alpha-beta plait domain-containing protein n=1 Tax=Rosa chinensis TaxID=74649 RepID=A0A2P6P324_ROSCH|nr:glycine-rich RNA-binding protein 2, mitochondrial [Rosa chinensis]PRQ16337.1 putative nucleotide-binding alpha-beta plait domain-containing protein [Rosa chinensis]